MRRRDNSGAGGLGTAAVLAVALACAAPALAQSGTGAATANASVSQGIFLQNTRDMNFGDIASSSSPGTVTLTALGVLSSTGGAAPVTNPANPPAAAAYSVDILGAKGTKKFWIQLPVNGAILLTGPGAPMALSNFTASAPCAQTAAAPPGASGPCSAAPTIFTVGATLSIGANQTPGTYTGTFTITAHRF